MTTAEVVPQLREIWREALNSGSFTDKEHFIEVGGDSLAAMLCIAHVRESFQVNLHLEDFFLEDATIEEMAALIARSSV